MPLGLLYDQYVATEIYLSITSLLEPNCKSEDAISPKVVLIIIDTIAKRLSNNMSGSISGIFTNSLKIVKLLHLYYAEDIIYF